MLITEASGSDLDLRVFVREKQFLRPDAGTQQMKEITLKDYWFTNRPREAGPVILATIQINKFSLLMLPKRLVCKSPLQT